MDSLSRDSGVVIVSHEPEDPQLKAAAKAAGTAAASGCDGCDDCQGCGGIHDEQELAAQIRDYA